MTARALRAVPSFVLRGSTARLARIVAGNVYIVSGPRTVGPNQFSSAGKANDVVKGR